MPEIMSNASDMSETGKFSGQKTGKWLEKSNFSVTCSLLSQYLKENGSFGDLSLGIGRDLEGKDKSGTFRQTATMNLLPKIETFSETSETTEDISDRNLASRNVKSMDLFPQHAGLAPSATMDDAMKTGDIRRATDSKGLSQMTIFYGGRVLVFDDFPADKAKELMLMATNGIPQNSTTIISSPAKDRGNFPQPSSSNIVPNSNNTPPRPQTEASDLPIARKASLHRFLEKRKDRINSRSPYQLKMSSPVSTPAPGPAGAKPMESKSWLGLASQALEPLGLRR